MKLLKIFFSFIFVLALIIISFLVGKNQLNSKSSISTNSNNNLTFGTTVLKVPKDFSIGKTYLISNNNKQYIIEAAGYSSGPCPWEDDGTQCSGYDEDLPGFTTLRIWKNKYGVIAINPQVGTQEESYVIYGYNPSGKDKYIYLTAQEVQMWKNIITGKTP